jgi:hypothetical protein
MQPPGVGQKIRRSLTNGLDNVESHRTAISLPLKTVQPDERISTARSSVTSVDNLTSRSCCWSEDGVSQSFPAADQSGYTIHVKDGGIVTPFTEISPPSSVPNLGLMLRARSRLPHNKKFWCVIVNFQDNCSLLVFVACFCDNPITSTHLVGKLTLPMKTGRVCDEKENNRSEPLVLGSARPSVQHKLLCKQLQTMLSTQDRQRQEHQQLRQKQLQQMQSMANHRQRLLQQHSTRNNRQPAVTKSNKTWRQSAKRLGNRLTA